MNDQSEDSSGKRVSRPRRKSVRRAGPPPGDSPAPAIYSETTAAPTNPQEPVRLSKGVDDVVAEPKLSKPAWLLPLLAAAAAAVLVVLAVGVGLLTIANNRASERSDEQAAERDSYVEAAKTTVLNLTTIHADTAKADVDKILDNASGEFLDEFQGRIEPFVSIVRDARVDTDGEIVAAGIESETDGEAVVLVAAKTMVSNAGTDEPQPRTFRMRLTVTDVDGRLTTSKVEFVP